VLRLTGKVVKIDQRSGQSPDKVTGELKPWSFDIITVLVADQAIVPVQKFSSNATQTPPIGAQVDVAVEVDVFRGVPSYQLVKPWEDLFPKLAAVQARTGS
jgi:hypothetical protein